MARRNVGFWQEYPDAEGRLRMLLDDGMSYKEIAALFTREYGVPVSYTVIGCKANRMRKGTTRTATSVAAAKPMKIRTLEEELRDDKATVGEKDRYKAMERKYEAALKESNVADQLIARIGELVPALPSIPAPKPLKVSREQSVESAVLVGSCWHIGETINLEEMGGLNQYNFDIFTRRLQYLVDKTVSFTQENMSNHRFQELHVFLTGDMVSGIIHDELVETNELQIVDQALMGALVVAQALRELAGHFPRVVVTGVAGNHGRTQPQKQYKHKGTKSWDFVFYNVLSLLLQKQRNVQFIIPKSYWAQVEVQGHVFQVQHGDTVKGHMGIPFYGFKRELGKWLEINAVMGKLVRYTVLSHYHTTASMQTGIGEFIMNGSLKGGDEYAIGLGLYNDPVQKLFGVHERYGKTWELSLNAKNAEDRGPSRYAYNLAQPLAYQLPA